MAYPAVKPAKSAPFKDYLNYYMDRVGLSQNKLAICARINQSRLNKIYNGTIKNVSVDTLVCICLALGLNEDETHDLLARQERAFSPAEPAHQVYLELIRIYSKKEIIYDTTPQNLSTILEYTVNLANIPHILLGGATGSDKSVLLKFLLMQALRKGAEVSIADFKGGVDFPPVWHKKCRICFDEQELLNLLTGLVEELQRHKKLFASAGQYRPIQHRNGCEPAQTDFYL